MATNKRRKAIGSDPLADAAPKAGSAPADEHPAEPAGSVESEDLPQRVDVHVPPAPGLRPVPRKGALDPKDRVRTLLVGLLLALMVAVSAQQLNRTSELKAAFGDVSGQFEETNKALDAERKRADSLSKTLATTQKRLAHTELLVAEADATSRTLDAAFTELARATASAGQWAEIAGALSAVRRDLGFAWRWDPDRWPLILAELDSGDTMRLGRRARPAELNALRGQVTVQTLQALADASDGLRPWRSLGADERLDPYPSIPERGLLLLLLLDAGMSASDLSAVPFESASLRNQGLGGADLTGIDLNRGDLRGADLSRANLTATNIVGAVYDAQTRWPIGFDLASSGAVLEGSEALSDAPPEAPPIPEVPAELP
jgi:hypothetical protein